MFRLPEISLRASHGCLISLSRVVMIPSLLHSSCPDSRKKSDSEANLGSGEWYYAIPRHSGHPFHVRALGIVTESKGVEAYLKYASQLTPLIDAEFVKKAISG
jgi:hypothetical protein